MSRAKIKRNQNTIVQLRSSEHANGGICQYDFLLVFSETSGLGKTTVEL